MWRAKQQGDRTCTQAANTHTHTHINTNSNLDMTSLLLKVDTTQTVALKSLLFMFLETLVHFYPADTFDFKSLTRFRIRQIIWMRQRESGFTQTGVRSGQRKTCMDMSTHTPVCTTLKRLHMHQGKNHTYNNKATTERACEHMHTQQLYWPGPDVVEKGWSYLCGHWQGHFPDWSPHMTSHQINLLTKSLWVTKH